MKKKIYIVPSVETVRYGADVVMHAIGGDASMPNAEFNNTLPSPERNPKAF